SSQTNYTYQGDTTYYISGTVISKGTNTFEGGAVLKFATNGSIQLTAGSPSPVLNWQAGPYRPVIFTAKEDNSVGQVITSATVSGYYGNPMLELVAASGTTNLTNLRISYAKTGLQLSSMAANLYNAQFVNCQNAMDLASGANALLGNALFSGNATNFIF